MTHHLDSARRSVVTAEAMVLPQDAYDSEYYEKRNSDNWLQDKSVAMRTTRVSIPVVPVGGTRRVGGYPASCVARGAVPQVPLCGPARTVSPHRTVAGRRGANFPPERTSTMCAHNPPCPTAMAPDREAARPVAHRPEQGWSLLCNGVLVFEDTGELLPDGRVVAPHRPLALTVGSAA
ncbi:hypothetical protein GA0115253_1081114 [Streptomyces sp. Termitarium-T10T-6]|nr:hypothetical protein GA0115253_1081114 [Streptomyces sp. Termitarium-T10T-6]